MSNPIFNKRTMAGLRRAATEAGPESFLGEILTMPLSKRLRTKIRKNIWKHVSLPAMKADTWLGSKLQKIPGMKGLFTAHEQIPLPKKGYHQTIERASAIEPVAKVRNLAVPIFAGIGIDKAIHPENVEKTASTYSQDCGMIEKDFQKTATIIQNAELREKIASTMLQLNSKNKEHEKRAQATKLLYKQAEMGLAALPSTYDEYEQKLASLLRQDLAVLEKAMELTAIDGIKLGELSGNDTNTVDAATTFLAEILS